MFFEINCTIIDILRFQKVTNLIFLKAIYLLSMSITMISRVSAFASKFLLKFISIKIILTLNL